MTAEAVALDTTLVEEDKYRSDRTGEPVVADFRTRRSMRPGSLFSLASLSSADDSSSIDFLRFIRLRLDAEDTFEILRLPPSIDDGDAAAPLPIPPEEVAGGSWITAPACMRAFFMSAFSTVSRRPLPTETAAEIAELVEPAVPRICRLVVLSFDPCLPRACLPGLLTWLCLLLFGGDPFLDPEGEWFLEPGADTGL